MTTDAPPAVAADSPPPVVDAPAAPAKKAGGPVPRLPKPDGEAHKAALAALEATIAAKKERVAEIKALLDARAEDRKTGGSPEVAAARAKLGELRDSFKAELVRGRGGACRMGRGGGGGRRAGGAVPPAPIDTSEKKKRRPAWTATPGTRHHLPLAAMGWHIVGGRPGGVGGAWQVGPACAGGGLGQGVGLLRAPRSPSPLPRVRAPPPRRARPESRRFFPCEPGTRRPVPVKGQAAHAGALPPPTDALILQSRPCNPFFSLPKTGRQASPA